MDEKSKLQLENLFIQLKNQGKSNEEISIELRVDLAQINQWDLNLSEEYKKAPENHPIEVRIVGKDAQGQYLYDHSIQFEFSLLDKIRFDLFRASSVSEKEMSNPDLPEYFKDYPARAKEALSVIEKYFVDVRINDLPDNKVTVNYNLNSEDPEVQNKAKEAIAFYVNVIYMVERQQNKLILIKKPSENVYRVKEAILPVAIKQFKIKDFHGIKDVSIQEIPVDSNWIFITGENGFGKTVVLRALAIGFIGNRDNDQILTDEANALIDIEYSFFGESKINRTWRPEESSRLNFICCYGPNRLNVSANDTNNEIERKNSLTYNLFNNDGVLLNIENELIICYYSDNDRFKQYVELFKKLIPTIDEIQFDEDNRRIYYLEKDVEANKSFGQRVRFEHLASGVKSLIAMVGDLTIRMQKSQPQIKLLNDYCGIVIIDELDIHWHPKWQREIPKLLTSLFPRIQFIATTHSAIPLLGAPEGSIFLNVHRSSEEGITIRKVDIEIENLLPNNVLTSPMFDMESITSVLNKRTEDVRTEDTFGEIEEDDENRRIIDEFEEGNDTFPDELFK